MSVGFDILFILQICFMNMSLILQSRKSARFSLDYLRQGDGIGGVKRLFFQNIWNFQIFSLYLQSIKTIDMETTALNPTQMHLLKTFAFNGSEEYAREVQEVLTRHFQDRLDAEADRLWDEGILDQQKLDEIRQMDLHAK